MVGAPVAPLSRSDGRLLDKIAPNDLSQKRLPQVEGREAVAAFPVWARSEGF
jgi:hypothetical protein